METAFYIIAIGNALMLAVFYWNVMPEVFRDLRKKYRPEVSVKCDDKTIKLDHDNTLYVMSALEYKDFGLRVATSPGCITDKVDN